MPMQGAESGELARSIQEMELDGVSAEGIAANGQGKRNPVIIRKRVIAITRTVGLTFAKFCTGSPTFVSISTVSVSMLMVLIYLFSYMIVSCGYEWEVRGMQNEVHRQSSRAARYEAKMQEYQDLVSRLSRKSQRKSLGIFTVTAYDPIESCKPFDDRFTSKGLPAGMGVAAVNPSVIPYGSVLYIPSLGRYFFACDTGTAMRRGDGKNIDILMPTVEEALAFGRKRLKVEIVDLYVDETSALVD